MADLPRYAPPPAASGDGRSPAHPPSAGEASRTIGTARSPYFFSCCARCVPMHTAATHRRQTDDGHGNRKACTRRFRPTHTARVCQSWPRATTVVPFTVRAQLPARRVHTLWPVLVPSRVPPPRTSRGGGPTRAAACPPPDKLSTRVGWRTAAAAAPASLPSISRCGRVVVSKGRKRENRSKKKKNGRPTRPTTDTHDRPAARTWRQRREKGGENKKGTEDGTEANPRRRPPQHRAAAGRRRRIGRGAWVDAGAARAEGQSGNG